MEDCRSPGFESRTVVLYTYGTFVWYRTIKKLLFFWNKKKGVGITFILEQIEYLLTVMPTELDILEGTLLDQFSL